MQLDADHKFIPLFITATESQDELLSLLVRDSATERAGTSHAWAVITGPSRSAYIVGTVDPTLTRGTSILAGASLHGVIEFWRANIHASTETSGERLARTNIFGVLDDKSLEDHRLLMVEDLGRFAKSVYNKTRDDPVLEQERKKFFVEGVNPWLPGEDKIVDTPGGEPVSVAECVTAYRVRFDQALQQAVGYEEKLYSFEEFYSEEVVGRDMEENGEM